MPLIEKANSPRKSDWKVAATRSNPLGQWFLLRNTKIYLLKLIYVKVTRDKGNLYLDFYNFIYIEIYLQFNYTYVDIKKIFSYFLDLTHFSKADKIKNS